MTHSLAVPDLRKFVESRQTCTKTHFSDVCEPFQAKKNFHQPNFLPGHSPIKIRVFEASRSQLSADFSIHKAILARTRASGGRNFIQNIFGTLFWHFHEEIFFEFFDPPPPPPHPTTTTTTSFDQKRRFLPEKTTKFDKINAFKSKT